jgi:hypothetical protein
LEIGLVDECPNDIHHREKPSFRFSVKVAADFVTIE